MQDIDAPSKANEHADIAFDIWNTFGSDRDEELDALINAEDAALHNHWH